MKSQVAVSAIEWPNDTYEGSLGVIHFKTFRKGLFGGPKEVKEFRGWTLAFEIDEDGAIGNALVMDTGLQIRTEVGGDLIPGILLAGEMFLKESGEAERGVILRQSATSMISNMFTEIN